MQRVATVRDWRDAYRLELKRKRNESSNVM